MSIEKTKKAMEWAKEDLAKTDEEGGSTLKIGDNKLNVVLYSRNVTMDVGKGELIFWHGLKVDVIFGQVNSQLVISIVYNFGP